MKSVSFKLPRPRERQALLIATRNLKMARSPHAYVRGNTLKFYEWLKTVKDAKLPNGPPVWICGDCHTGNLGPVANADGRIDIQIRDLDQTVVGNPTHDLIRLGLSLASAARGSGFPGVTTAKMLEAMMEGYEGAFGDKPAVERKKERPQPVHAALKLAANRSWKHLAKERIENTKPTIPLGRRLWPISKDERREITKLMESEESRQLATLLRSRDNDATVEIIDAAFWVKGCSSLGRLRYAVLLGVGSKTSKDMDFCLMDMKEAVKTAAPRHPKASMPRDNAERVVEGARHLAPFLGERMLATRFFDRAMFVRELRPQDLKLEIDQLPREDATSAARFLATVVGTAHARQMDAPIRRAWRDELRRNRTKVLDAPSWLWSAVVQLLVEHERGYLEHCRRYALEAIHD